MAKCLSISSIGRRVTPKVLYFATFITKFPCAASYSALNASRHYIRLDDTTFAALRDADTKALGYGERDIFRQEG